MPHTSVTRLAVLVFAVTAPACASVGNETDEVAQDLKGLPMDASATALVDASATALADASGSGSGAIDPPPNDCAATVAVYNGQVSLYNVCVKAFITRGTTPVLVAGGVATGDAAPYTASMWLPCGVPVTLTGYSTGCLNLGAPTGTVIQTLQPNMPATINITVRYPRDPMNAAPPAN